MCLDLLPDMSRVLITTRFTSIAGCPVAAQCFQPVRGQLPLSGRRPSEPRRHRNVVLRGAHCGATAASFPVTSFADAGFFCNHVSASLLADHFSLRLKDSFVQDNGVGKYFARVLLAKHTES